MILVFIITFCAIIALGFGALAAWSDVNSLTIPNSFSVAIGSSFLVAFLLALVFAPETAVIDQPFRVFVQTTSDGLLIGQKEINLSLLD